MSLESWCWANAQICGGPLNKFVLTTICDGHCAENPHFGINQKAIAKSCEMTLEQLWCCIRDLERRGFLVARRERDGRNPFDETDIDWFGFDIPVEVLR
ncbi:MAG: hypothetical protein CSA85_00490 [Alphaproteobacteria bacterium]|nr:MAG: hypothetical protein CSA85_00490 [Alphaproteobacteria bacterium]